ncbi:MAG TPA: sigma 54-interacting transcriptional regulator [Desulfitobacterium dehalogenans]|uniref:Sigma 54-interacting transcriptional regulator n=1 Tax=Desulfitobacterium dehalogenans TaxID=36854 RepID=A0A7C7D3P1_9FIRM|nr:sigma 54-interacting transcriptional regulator [Desulfitobacterium dehalogenans]
MSRNRILIVAADDKVNIAYKKQLEGIFEDALEIQTLTLDDDPDKYLGYDLILAASQAISDQVKKQAPLNARIITVIRNINVLELNKVFNIEPGSTAIVVSNFMHAATETVNLLKEIGIHHVKFIPYCPGCDLESSVLNQVDLAITAGASHFVPERISRITDLGIKIIDISTIVEIIVNLGLPLERINLFTLRYMKEVIDLNWKISDLKSLLETVLDASANGILALDLEGRILFMNKDSEIYVSPDKPLKIGAKISKLTKNKDLIEFISSDRQSDVLRIGKKDLMVSKTYLKSADKITGTVISFGNVSELQNMEKEIRRKLSPKGNTAKYNFSDIIGQSKSIRTIVEMAKKSSRSDLSVLLLGENGTGKELFAQAIHQNSSRRDGPFVAVNFAALPENLIESELFGYEEGAFTGARKGGKPGFFELAHKGTIFLDEIGDAPLSLQARLLRVIQEKEVQRLGGVCPIPVDVRVIAATNCDLKQNIQHNLFRKDLYYRINTITLQIPPLRERLEDIPQIINDTMASLHAQKAFSEAAFQKLMRYHWPGNIRELQNLVHYVVELVEDTVIQVSDLPHNLFTEEYDDELNPIEYPSSSHNEPTGSLTALEKKGDLRIFTHVLAELEAAERSYLKASRIFLIQKLSEKGVPVNDNAMRKVLSILEEMNYITIGSTKQGTRITKKGKELLTELKTELIKEDYRWNSWT